MNTSNAHLSDSDIEKKIQVFPFPRPGYQPQRYDSASGSYVDHGDYVEPYTETMEEGEVSWSDFIEYLEWTPKGEPAYFYDIPEVGKIFFEKSFGGEGQGDEYWFVIRVENDGDPDRYFRMDGWYASHEGGYYDGNLTEVKVVERVVAFYE